MFYMQNSYLANNYIKLIKLVILRLVRVVPSIYIYETKKQSDVLDRGSLAERVVEKK